MTQESVRQSAPLRAVRSLSFDEIPRQSRLFLDYLKDPLSLKKYYPNAAASPRDLAGYRETVLSSYRTDRSELCMALSAINRGAGELVERNIDFLAKEGTIAIVTGQQAGLFTGPLYTIYKALSAIRLAADLRSAGVDAVPVFWVASEDHDIAEIDYADVLGKDGPAQIRYRPREFTDGASVGDIRFDANVDKSVEDLMKKLPHTEFSDALRAMTAAAYSSEETYASAFQKLITSIFGRYGLIVIDPLHASVKRLASPIYVDAVRRTDEIVRAIRERDLELVQAGYTPQVTVEADYFPLFWHDEEGRRLGLRQTGDGMFRVKGEKRQLHRDELLKLALDEPSRLSPGVMLRPVVQDHLLPALCYFGGGAEISYFAQNSEAYRVLGRPVTPIFHRQSFTIVEPREQRNMAHLGWELKSLFHGKEAAVMDAAERELSPELARTFGEVEKEIDGELNRLDQRLSDIDANLAASLAKRRRKITYHIKTLRDKALRAEVRKDETMRRRIANIFDSLLPDGKLQERKLTVLTFLNKYGPAFINWIYDAIDLDDKGHRIVEI